MIPKTMMAVLTRGFGGLDRLDYCEVPTPEPIAEEVLVAVAACGLNNSDIWTREGKYGSDRDPDAMMGVGRRPMAFPIIQGLDVVGRIVAVGAGVPESRVGERVICNPFHYAPNPGETGFAASFGSGRSGGYAQYVTLRTENAYAIDSACSDAALATFPCAYTTAEHMLDATAIRAGETVLVTGASGGVGSALVQLLNVRGARAIAVTSRPWADAVAGLKPAAVVLRDAGDLVEQVAAALGAPRVDAVADVVGGALFVDALALLRPRGRYVTAGATGGAVVPLDLRTIYLKHLRLFGVSIGYARHFEAMLAHLAARRLRPLLARTFPLAQIREAQALFVSKDFFGNIAVLPGAGY